MQSAGYLAVIAGVAIIAAHDFQTGKQSVTTDVNSLNGRGNGQFSIPTLIAGTPILGNPVTSGPGNGSNGSVSADVKNTPGMMQQLIGGVWDMLGFGNGDTVKRIAKNVADVLAASKDTAVSAKSANAQWSLITGDDVTYANGQKGWQLDILASLEGQGDSAAQARAESDGIAALIAAGKIKNQTQLTSYENSWNYITKHAKDANDAHAEFTAMIQSGAVVMGSPTRGGPAFLSAWDTLISEGVNPASISAAQIAKQMAIAAANAATFAQDLGAAAGLTAAAQGAIKAGRGTAAGEYAKLAAEAASGKLAAGGILNEPVLGVGQNSGASYLIGEAGPEMVIPMSGGSPNIGALGSSSGGGGGGATIVIDMRGTQVFKTQDLDNIVQALGSRIAKVLLPNAGVKMQFKR
jgi:hypothetical protein